MSWWHNLWWDPTIIIGSSGGEEILQSGSLGLFNSSSCSQLTGSDSDHNNRMNHTSSERSHHDRDQSCFYGAFPGEFTAQSWIRSKRATHKSSSSSGPSFATNAPPETQITSLNLKPELLRGIYAYGFDRPSAIQPHAIVPVVKGYDVLAQVQSGTAKTATFSISILQQLDMSIKDTQALILTPTRELAQQIQKVVSALGDYMDIECHACVGGTNLCEDIIKLREGVHVVVGTPGRIFDMINRRALRMDKIKISCLDEADEMLSRGFKDQIYKVFQRLQRDTQLVLLSATMPADVSEFTKKLMHDPVKILFKEDELTFEGIKQFVLYRG